MLVNQKWTKIIVVTPNPSSETFPLSLLQFILLVVRVRQSLVIKLLLDEAKHRRCVRVGPVSVRKPTHLCVNVLVCYYAELQTHRANHQNRDVVQGHGQERSPEQDVGPHVCYLTIQQHRPIVDFEPRKNLQLFKRVASLTLSNVRACQLQKQLLEIQSLHKDSEHVEQHSQCPDEPVEVGVVSKCQSGREETQPQEFVLESSVQGDGEDSEQQQNDGDAFEPFSQPIGNGNEVRTSIVI